MGYTLKINLNSAYSGRLVHCELQIYEFSLTLEGKQFPHLKKSIVCVELKIKGIWRQKRRIKGPVV